MSYAIYGYGKDDDSLLLVNSSFWVINGEWQLLLANGLFFVEATGQQINIKLLGHIDYDGDYNSTLERFRSGEGQHTSAEEKPVVEMTQSPELCKRKYYGIECSCSKCNKR
jgi:hypothetical protein